MDEVAGAVLDADFWITVGCIAALIAVSAFFSGSETALTASSRGKLKSQGDRGQRGARAALKLTEDGERLIGAILLGNNLVNILAAALATALFTRIYGETGVVLATVSMTVLVLIFAEVLPKTYAITNPETAARRLAPLLRPVVAVFAPLVMVVRFIVRGVLRVFGVRIDPNRHVLSLHEEIAGALALGHSEGMVEKAHRDRLLGALDLGERTVEEIMLHRSQIEFIDADTPIDAVIAQCVQSSHSRLPVFRGGQENIIGVLHVRDLMREVHVQVTSGQRRLTALRQLRLESIVRPPYFVPETTPLDEQMRHFLHRRNHFALVVDEYGALHGLITLEDILEEIVGEIEDEFDLADATPMVAVEGNEVLVDGAMTIRDLNRAMEWQLPDDAAITVAGLVIHESQQIPQPGQVFSFHGFRFEVVERLENRLTRLRIRPL